MSAYMQSECIYLHRAFQKVMRLQICRLSRSEIKMPHCHELHVSYKTLQETDTR